MEFIKGLLAFFSVLKEVIFSLKGLFALIKETKAKQDLQEISAKFRELGNAKTTEERTNLARDIATIIHSKL